MLSSNKHNHTTTTTTTTNDDNNENNSNSDTTTNNGDNDDNHDDNYRLGDIENPFLKQFEDQLTFTRRLSSEPSAAAGFDLFGNPMDATERRLAGGTTKSTYDGGAGGLDFKGLYGENTRTKFWNYRGSLY